MPLAEWSLQSLAHREELRTEANQWWSKVLRPQAICLNRANEKFNLQAWTTKQWFIVLTSLDMLFVILLWDVWQKYCQVEKWGYLGEAAGQMDRFAVYVLKILQTTLSLPPTLTYNNYRAPGTATRKQIGRERAGIPSQSLYDISSNCVRRQNCLRLIWMALFKWMRYNNNLNMVTSFAHLLGRLSTQGCCSHRGGQTLFSFLLLHCWPTVARSGWECWIAGFGKFQKLRRLYLMRGEKDVCTSFGFHFSLQPCGSFLFVVL